MINEYIQYNLVKRLSYLISIKSGRCCFCNKTVAKDSITRDCGTITISFGYASENDGDTFQTLICDKCFDDILKDKSKLIMSEINNYDIKIDLKQEVKNGNV